jgi:hypothetical protein
LELSNRSLEHAVSLDWSTNQWSERGKEIRAISLLRVLPKEQRGKAFNSVCSVLFFFFLDREGEAPGKHRTPPALCLCVRLA